MCLLVVYYASNNKYMSFANASSAGVMLGDPAITAGAWQTDMVRLVDGLTVGRLFVASSCN
jgi:hypothetical protein